MSVRPSAALLLCALLAAGEPLVCRGFDATSAIAAVSSASGRLVRLDEELDHLRQRPLWFVLPNATQDAGLQALAHTLGCWWTSDQGPSLSARNRLPPRQATVRSYTALHVPLPGIEALVRQLLDPWLGGDGGLAMDTATGSWTATTTPAGHARLEALLGALGDPKPRAPHLLPGVSTASRLPLARAPRGADLAAWALDLAMLSQLALALAPELDPRASPPPGAPSSVAEAITALAAGGISAAIQHDCLCLGLAEPVDRRHPAERAVIAVLPARHLCPDEAALGRLATRLASEVLPTAWRQPGWTLSALPWRRDLLVVGDPPAIHAVMRALEEADRNALQP